MSLLETLKSTLQGEPIEDPKDREEYFDRLGIEEEPVKRPTPTPRPTTRWNNEGRGSEMTSLHDYNYIPDRHSTTELYQRRVTHYVGSREHFTTKTLSVTQNEMLERTIASGADDVIKKSLERVFEGLLREVEDVLFRMSDVINRDSSNHGRSLRNGEMLAMTVESYLLRMQDYVNFGFHVEQTNNPEKFSRELRVLVFNDITRMSYTFDIDRH